MNIQGAEGLNPQELNFELQRGGKLVRYYYCISLVAVSFRRTSQIHLIRAGENAAMKGMTYILVSVLLGWWGIPWGPIWTIQSLYINLKGGKDITSEVLKLAQQVPPAAKAAAATSSGK